ncbi:MAG: hypothetical protein A2046_10235 [Bacteroidetes bacterium GWA2_30_7]|nr:MAG: hypothetical protein A2046_10235 [Bacteroidetes bacterium GWA2_30_7]
MIKKTILILLTLNILYFSFGYFFVFKSIQKSIKKEIKSIMAHDINNLNLEVFHFKKDIYTNSPEFFNWHDNNKEFFYFGKLYDIVKSEISDNEIIIYAFNDKNEQHLISNYNNYINNYTGTQLPNKIKVQNLLAFMQLTYIQTTITFNFNCNQNNLKYFDIKNLYEFNSLFNSHHPPKA